MSSNPIAPPKYSIAEIERKWLVEPDALPSLEGQPYREIEDLYIAGTQLRLRRMESTDGQVVFKLCKKYGKTTALSEPITNLYLSEAEYRLLSGLAGNTVRKRRYSVAGGALDVYEGGVITTFEVEFGSEAEAQRYVPPALVGREVTNLEAYSGAALAEAGA